MMNNLNQLKGYQVEYSKVAQKVMSKLNGDVVKTIKRKLKLLVGGEHNLDIIKLKGYEPPLYRLRVGDYRVIYRVLHDRIVVYVVYVDTRKDVYQSLERFLG